MDIVERLRTIKDPPDYDSPLCFEAADEIERLRKQNAVLETELALVWSMTPNVKVYQTGTGVFAALNEDN